MSVLLALSAILATAGAPSVPLDAERQARLNALVERDRPGDLVVGGPFDEKLHKKYHAEVDRQNANAKKAAAEYRRTRSVKAWRALLDAVNRGGGLRPDDLIGGNTLSLVFATLHDVGPPLDDVDNGDDAEFAARRHHAMMRLLARYLWKWHWVQTPQQRIAAAYLDDCERRPDADRPSGNHHDPNCGFYFEMGYKLQRVGDRFWEDRNLPQSFADFAAGVPTARPEPITTDFMDYPLTMPASAGATDRLWAGNTRKFAVIYAMPYQASREVQEKLYKEQLANREADRAKANARLEAEADLRRRLTPEWERLWAKAVLTGSEQLELEDLSASLGRLDVYRTRYAIISYDRIARYCFLGWADACGRQDAIDAADRARRAGPDFGKPSSATVTVRKYDQNGNYVGSTTTTRIDAELSGARPQ